MLCENTTFNQCGDFNRVQVFIRSRGQCASFNKVKDFITFYDTVLFWEVQQSQSCDKIPFFKFLCVRAAGGVFRQVFFKKLITVTASSFPGLRLSTVFVNQRLISYQGTGLLLLMSLTFQPGTCTPDDLYSRKDKVSC